MNLMNEIEKKLYKENPAAIFQAVKNGICQYEAELSDGTSIRFSIPVSDMGETEFKRNIEAKHLRRWIVATT
jgi:hypothetical protein